MNDLLVEYVKNLPFAIQSIFILLLFILPLFLKAIIPITSFLSKTILNKTKSSLTEILSSKKLDNDLILESEKELSIIYKMEITQCRDRQLALYFYELSNESKHIFPYNKFKRLYRFLTLEKDDILINKKGIKWANLNKMFLALVFFGIYIYFLVMCVLTFSIDFAELSLDCFYYSLLGIISFLPVPLLSNSIIWNFEIDEFNLIKNIYHKKITARLIKQYKYIVFF